MLTFLTAQSRASDRGIELWQKAVSAAVHTSFYVLLCLSIFAQRRAVGGVGDIAHDHMLPQRGLPLTKCPGLAAIGPALRNPNSPQALPEEFDPP